MIRGKIIEDQKNGDRKNVCRLTLLYIE